MNKIFSALLFVIFITGCEIVETSPNEIYSDKVKLNEYLIGNGDQLYISVWQNPELSLSVPVRPDGKVSMPLIGDQVASGISAAQLSKDIEQRLNEFIRIPQVTVIVTSPISSNYLTRVRVTGAIKNPLSIPYRRDMTILDLVLEAGGLTPFAEGDESVLYRKTPDGVVAYPININEILDKGILTSNYEMRPADILIIPESVF